MNVMQPPSEEEWRKLLSLLKDGDTPETVDVCSDKYTYSEAVSIYQLLYRTSREFAVRALAFRRGIAHRHNEY